MQSKPLATHGRHGFTPLYIATFGCTAAMMGFVVLAGSLAEMFLLAPWQIGITVTVSGLVWVLSAGRWGQRSDRIGRRPVLIQGAAIFLVTYLLLTATIGVGIALGMSGMAILVALIVSRAGLGLGFAAIPPAANAYIADRTPPNLRAGEMGRLGAAQAMGVVAGPALISLLAWAGLFLPIAILAALPLLVLMSLLWGLNEPAATHSARRTSLSMLDPRLRLVFLVAAGAMFCVGTAQIAVGFVMIDRFALSVSQGAQFAGLALTAVGLALVPAQLLVRRLGWAPGKLMVSGTLLAAAGFGIAAMAGQVSVLIGGYALSGFGMGWVFSSVSAQAANSVDAHEQGRAAGALSSSQGVGAMMGPLLGALIYELGNAAPFWVSSGILVVLSGLAMMIARSTARTG